jgi:hypothetical protein
MIPDTVTNDQIRDLAAEAWEAGDTVQVAVCLHALDRLYTEGGMYPVTHADRRAALDVAATPEAARAECARVIAEASTNRDTARGSRADNLWRDAIADRISDVTYLLRRSDFMGARDNLRTAVHLLEAAIAGEASSKIDTILAPVAREIIPRQDELLATCRARHRVATCAPGESAFDAARAHYGDDVLLGYWGESARPGCHLVGMVSVRAGDPKLPVWRIGSRSES